MGKTVSVNIFVTCAIYTEDSSSLARTKMVAEVGSWLGLPCQTLCFAQMAWMSWMLVLQAKTLRHD